MPTTMSRPISMPKPMPRPIPMPMLSIIRHAGKTKLQQKRVAKVKILVVVSLTRMTSLTLLSGETFNTAEYQLKRERNNIAVRKSREKAKKNFLELQRKERHLQEENIRLDNLVESLTKELDKMRALYASLRETGIVDDGTTF